MLLAARPVLTQPQRNERLNKLPVYIQALQGRTQHICGKHQHAKRAGNKLQHDQARSV
jgi:hypothetical protein